MLVSFIWDKSQLSQANLKDPAHVNVKQAKRKEKEEWNQSPRLNYTSTFQQGVKLSDKEKRSKEKKRSYQKKDKYKEKNLMKRKILRRILHVGLWSYIIR